MTIFGATSSRFPNCDKQFLVVIASTGHQGAMHEVQMLRVFGDTY